jgi:cytochrome c biogenesis protein CcmG/thiol:disulfide interchange protein DsbE
MEPARIVQMSEPTDPQPEFHRRSPLSWALMIGSLALVFGLLGLLVYRVAEGNPGKGLVASIRDGKKPMAPDLRTKVLWAHTETWDASARQALADHQVSLFELRGKPVVLNFWASWCIPCAHEAPRLVASATMHRGRVVFLGVDVKDFSSDARKFLRRYKVNYVSVRDGGSTTYDAYGLTGLPESYLLNGAGRIVAHKIGEISRQELEHDISGALEGKS